MKRLALTSIAAGLVLAAPAAGSYNHVQTVTLQIGSQPTAWASTEREPQTIPFEVKSVRVNGYAVRYAESKACVARMYGHGAAIEFSTCGRRAKLRIRAVALKPSTLVVRYLAPRY